MKVKIVQKGYEHFTGQIGITMFENAVSVDDVSYREACALAAIFSVRDAETGKEIGAIERERAVWDNANIPIPPSLKTASQKKVDAGTLKKPDDSENLGDETGGDDQGQAGGDGENGESGTGGEDQTGDEFTAYTREALEALADEGGIAAIREVGAKFGVKGTSIARLIDEILAAQGAN